MGKSHSSLRHVISYCDNTTENKNNNNVDPLAAMKAADMENNGIDAELPSLVAQAQKQDSEELTGKNSAAIVGNPGQYENAQGEVKRVLSPDVFDGCRFELNKSIGSKLAVSHTLWLGSQVVPGGFYQFGANAVAGSNAVDPETILISRITPDGRLDARWHQKLTDKLSSRLQSQISNEADQSTAVCDFDYVGEDFSSNLKVSQGPLLGLSYFQALNDKVSLGGEAYYHGLHHKSITSYCSRYASDDWTGVATYGSVGTIQLHYLRKLSQRTKLASELVYNATNGESTANIGAEFTLRQSRLMFALDQNGKISSTVEAKLTPMISFLLSAEIEHAKDDFKFGYGLQMGQ